MTNTAFNYQLNMTVEHCIECSIPFAITNQLQQRFRDNHESFYCPMGHQQYYPAKSDKEKLKAEVSRLERQVERKQKEKEWAQQDAVNAKNRERAQKGAKTRLKNRISQGVCPCCNRTFKQLAAHMKNKHPDFTAIPSTPNQSETGNKVVVPAPNEDEQL